MSYRQSKWDYATPLAPLGERGTRDDTSLYDILQTRNYGARLETEEERTAAGLLHRVREDSREDDDRQIKREGDCRREEGTEFEFEERTDE